QPDLRLGFRGASASLPWVVAEARLSDGRGAVKRKGVTMPLALWYYYPLRRRNANGPHLRGAEEADRRRAARDRRRNVPRGAAGLHAAQQGAPARRALSGAQPRHARAPPRGRGQQAGAQGANPGAEAQAGGGALRARPQAAQARAAADPRPEAEPATPDGVSARRPT